MPVLGLVRASSRERTLAFIGAACPWSSPSHALVAQYSGGRTPRRVAPSASKNSLDLVADADVLHFAGGYHRYLADCLAAGAVGEALISQATLAPSSGEASARAIAWEWVRGSERR
ncbi:MAG: hypothetical protein ABR592_07125 [Nitriliruptorales bacterium]